MFAIPLLLAALTSCKVLRTISAGDYLDGLWIVGVVTGDGEFIEADPGHFQWFALQGNSLALLVGQEKPQVVRSVALADIDSRMIRKVTAGKVLKATLIGIGVGILILGILIYEVQGWW